MNLGQRVPRHSRDRRKKHPDSGILVESLEPRLCLAAPVAAVPRVSVTGPGQQVERGSDATFVVRLSAAPGTGKTVGVQFTTVNGNARAGVQYAPTNGVVSFTDQEREKIITVPTVANSPNPTGKPDLFSLVLSRPTNLKIQTSRATAAIVPIRPGVSVSDVAVNEGNGGIAGNSAVFEVRLAKAASKTVTVQYATANDGATANTDYLPAFGTLTFLPGETLKTVSVPVLGNAVPEADKTFVLNLSKAVNAPIVKGSATGFILNDDGDPVDATLVNPETVLVGNPGNPADPVTQFGYVASAYRIGKFEQTVDDYVKFLNAVAKSDPYRLFDASMAITRTGAAGSYQYAAKSSPQLPIEGVTWMNAVRFANWMHNGQGSASTETGAYDIGHGRILSIAGTTAITDGPANIRPGDALILVSKDGRESTHTVTSVVGSTVRANFTSNESGFLGWDYTAVPQTHNRGASCWIPTRDEWYKAAYYDPSAVAIGLASGYWRYATRSDTYPTNALDGSVNRANVNSAGPVPVGSYVGSGSYYGTFDQTGNVSELSETAIAQDTADGKRVFFDSYSHQFPMTTAGINSRVASYSLGGGLTYYSSFGFRLAYSANDDNANGRPAVAVQGNAVSVGNAGTVPIDFAVTLSAAYSKAVLIRYATADGSAMSGNGDYVPQSGWLIFAPGQTQKRVSVYAAGRPGLPAQATFNLVLSGPVNATLQTAVGVGTIRP